ncbi:MAG: tail fiber protein [Betaproteobacteria bacterium]
MSSQPFLGEIRMFGGNFAPVGYAFCNGQLLDISQNNALFSLLGTTFGGDGQTTFALPDLRGRLPLHQGQGPGLSSYVNGQSAGSETVTLTTQQIPQHSHAAQASSQTGTQAGPGNGLWAASGLNQFANANATQPMNSTLIQQAGGSQPHDNLMPYLAISCIIALQGIFPSRN